MKEILKKIWNLYVFVISIVMIWMVFIEMPSRMESVYGMMKSELIDSAAGSNISTEKSDLVAVCTIDKWKKSEYFDKTMLYVHSLLELKAPTKDNFEEYMKVSMKNEKSTEVYASIFLGCMKAAN